VALKVRAGGSGEAVYTSAEAELLAAYPQIRELFDKYQSAQIDLISINNRQEFVNGFRIGAQMMLEMLKPID
jgi:hypothetical protein